MALNGLTLSPMPKPWIFYCENEEKFWRTALEDVIARIEKTLRTFPDCRLGLAGGSTPKILYRRLASQNLPWEKRQHSLNK